MKTKRHRYLPYQCRIGISCADSGFFLRLKKRSGRPGRGLFLRRSHHISEFVRINKKSWETDRLQSSQTDFRDSWCVTAEEELWLALSFVVHGMYALYTGKRVSYEVEKALQDTTANERRRKMNMKKILALCIVALMTISSETASTGMRNPSRS